MKETPLVDNGVVAGATADADTLLTESEEAQEEEEEEEEVEGNSVVPNRVPIAGAGARSNIGNSLSAQNPTKILLNKSPGA
jgi:hypothetical protein